MTKAYPKRAAWPDVYVWICETFGKPTRTQRLNSVGTEIGEARACKWLYLNPTEAAKLFADLSAKLEAARNASESFVPLELTAHLHAVAHRNSPQSSVILYWRSWLACA